MKLTKKEKEELSNSFNISLPTFYNWEKNKPRLIELILLGLQKRKRIIGKYRRCRKTLSYDSEITKRISRDTRRN